MDEGFIVVLIAAGGICGLICLVGGIINLVEKIEKCNIARKRKEAISAVKLFRMVGQRVPCVTDAEYDDAVKYTIRKYHLADKNGALDTRNESLEYISILISEAINQNRIFLGILTIAQADADLAAAEDPEFESERKAITA